jgi:hypothetical protein
MHLKIEHRFSILEKEKGRYHSFPTLVRQQDQLWLACRSGSVSGRQAHGVDGKVLLFSAEVTRPDRWISHGSLFEPSADGTRNELDAILSAPETNLFFLATRDYAVERAQRRLSVKGPDACSDQQKVAHEHLRSVCNLFRSYP